MNPTIIRYIEHYGAELHIVPLRDGNYCAEIHMRTASGLSGLGTTVAEAMERLVQTVEKMEAE